MVCFYSGVDKNCDVLIHDLSLDKLIAGIAFMDNPLLGAAGYSGIAQNKRPPFYIK